MRIYSFFLVCLLASITALGQAPQAFKYQAVLRNETGTPIANSEIDVKIEISNGEQNIVYSELHETISDNFGVVLFNIGEPDQVLSGTMDDIDWGGNSFYIHMSMANRGEQNFKPLGVAQLLSVPYALFAKESGSAGITSYNDLKDKPDLSVFLQNENDPIFSNSPAFGIEQADINNWNAKSDFNGDYHSLTGRPDLSDTAIYLKNETDPIFTSSLASNITAQDTTWWGTQLQSPWTEKETTVTYDGAVLVGIEFPSVEGRLHVYNSDSFANAVYVNHTSKAAKSFGVYSEIHNSESSNIEVAALHGAVTEFPVNSTGKTIGVFGRAYNGPTVNYGKSYGILGMAADAQHGHNYGVYGDLIGEQDGAAIMGAINTEVHKVENGQWAGYFAGRVHVQDTLGVGTTQPQRALHVNDVMRLEPTSAPINPTLGDLYMDAADSTLKVYDGIQWREMW